jgi:glycosyltransferase involved in cell wall biosynthesis
MARLESKAKDLFLLSYPNNIGKGFAIRTGVQRSIAPVIVFTDVDFPYTMDSMIRVIKPILDGTSDVTFAVRNATYYAQLPAVRKGMSRMLKWVNRKVLGLHTSDTQGGLKAFNSSVRDLFLQGRINRYLFDLEFAYLLSGKKNLRVLPVEADLREGIQMSPVRMRILLGESVNFLKVLLRRVRSRD